MSNHPQTPKPPYKANLQIPQNRWERPFKQRPSKPNPPQTHIPFGIGKHRKSFGHV